MIEDRLYTRSEFLKVLLVVLAAFLFGGLLSKSGKAKRLLRANDSSVYGNSTYGGKA